MKKTASGLNRREFLKKAGVGSMALASLPVLGHLTATAVSADGQTNFRFVSVSQAATVHGVVHFMLMNGNGQVRHSQVAAAGSYVHFNNDPALPVPKPILGSGTWKARQLLDFKLIGTYGSLAAGEVEMDIDLVADPSSRFPSGAVIPARLMMVCNIGPAGLSTGEEEGFILTIPGAPFGSFVPLVPALGLTIFTTLNEWRD